MSSGKNVFERILKLETSANEMVISGKRRAEDYVQLLQTFVWGNTLPDIDWALTYERLGMKREYEVASRVLVVPSGDSRLWAVPMLQGITCNKVVAAYRRDSVQVYVYKEDLDVGLKNLIRDPIKGSYVVSFCRTVEADEENKGKSANVLATQNHVGITLLERLVLGYGHYVTTGEHLDVKCVTLCSGSRLSGGDVPRVDFDLASGRVYVGYYYPDDCSDLLRSRSVVSFAGEALPNQQ